MIANPCAASYSTRSSSSPNATYAGFSRSTCTTSPPPATPHARAYNPAHAETSPPHVSDLAEHPIRRKSILDGSPVSITSPHEPTEFLTRESAYPLPPRRRPPAPAGHLDLNRQVKRRILYSSRTCCSSTPPAVLQQRAAPWSRPTMQAWSEAHWASRQTGSARCVASPTGAAGRLW